MINSGVTIGSGSSFEINGVKYFFHLDKMYYDRLTKLLELSTMINFGMSVVGIYDILKDTFDRIQQLSFRSTQEELDKIKNPLLSLMKTAEGVEIKDLQKDQIDLIYEISTLYIISEDEDIAVLDDRVVTQKMQLFKDHLDFKELFHLARYVSASWLTSLTNTPSEAQ